MNEKILKEVLEWYDGHENCTTVDIKEFVDLIIDKTADAIFDEVKTQLKNEFEEGTLTHPFIISPEYYLDLKLKEIRDRCVQPKEIEENNVVEDKPAEL